MQRLGDKNSQKLRYCISNSEVIDKSECLGMRHEMLLQKHSNWHT